MSADTLRTTPGAGSRPPWPALWRAWEGLEGALDAAFGARANPLRHLGALGFLFFWVMLASGLYLYVVFEGTAAGAYRSIDALSATAIGSAARSLHRYAADSFVAVTALHLARELLAGRLTGPRWFAWVTGVVLIWFLYASGIGGYWLVGDQLAQWSLIATAEWFDALPLFGLATVRNFLSGGQMTDRFYALLAFLHVAIPLTLLFGMWLHIQRVTRADVAPARALALGTLAMLLVLAVARPATSMPPPDYGAVPGAVTVDWYLLFIHPLMEATTPVALWIMAAAGTLGLAALPWLVGARREPVARVDPLNCNGCGRCFADCPSAPWWWSRVPTGGAGPGSRACCPSSAPAAASAPARVRRRRRSARSPSSSLASTCRSFRSRRCAARPSACSPGLPAGRACWCSAATARSTCTGSPGPTRAW
ncbi:MAG: cytochrome b N-terminal domain-containing protein [Burkholderiales bacterium]|nr:cytochrome b N-terminal domain-containing protein [Burkholderiales bacterium]